MTIKPEVLATIERIDFCVDRKRPVDWDDWRELRAELLAMDAEIESLNAECKQHLRQAMENGRDANRAESRLAAALPLLQGIAGCQWFEREAPATVELINEHLRGHAHD